MPGVWCSVCAGDDTVLFESSSLRDIANLVDVMGGRDPSGAIVFVSDILRCLGSVIAYHETLPTLGVIIASHEHVVWCGLLVVFRGLYPPVGRSDPLQHQNTSEAM
jgi:hypothetical protein